jgi:hypothetical protein
VGAKATGLSDLIDDLKTAEETAVEAAKKVIGKGSLNVKRGAQKIIRASSPRGYLPHYPRAISYDVTASGTVVTGEIGPRRDRDQGKLGSYIELGTVHNAPIPHLSPALDAEIPATERYLEDVGARLLEGDRTPVEGPVRDPGD